MTNVSSRTRFLILRRDGFACVYCGRSSAEVELHIDHVHAKAKGGADDQSNYVAACRQCNGGKSTMSVLGDGSKKEVRLLPVASPGLCGKCFVTFDANNELKEQGVVRSKITDEIYLIQYFDWIMGSPATLRLVYLKTMLDWTLFEDDEHLRFWKDYEAGKCLKSA